MALFDYNGRRTASVNVVTVTTTPTQILAASNNRVAIHWFPASGGPVIIQTTPGGTTGTGLLLIQNSPPYKMDGAEVGDLVTKPWFAVTSVGSITIGYIEVMQG